MAVIIVSSILVQIIIIIIVIDRRKHFPMPLCPPQISHELVWDRIQPSVLRSRQLNDRLSHDTTMNMEVK
jgi:hypothetical protein